MVHTGEYEMTPKEEPMGGIQMKELCKHGEYLIDHWVFCPICGARCPDAIPKVEKVKLPEDLLRGIDKAGYFLHDAEHNGNLSSEDRPYYRAIANNILWDLKKKYVPENYDYLLSKEKAHDEG